MDITFNDFLFVVDYTEGESFDLTSITPPEPPDLKISFVNDAYGNTLFHSREELAAFLDYAGGDIRTLELKLLDCI